MNKKFLTVEELIEDEGFLKWFHQSDEQSIQQWEQWKDESPENHALLNEAVQLLSAIQFKEPEISDQQVNDAWYKIDIQLPTQLVSNGKIISLNRAKKWWTAAAVIIAVGVGLYLFRGAFKGEKLATDYGQIAEHILPDGSSVILNANSHLKTGDFIEGKTREVWMDGEAYFKVHKTSTKDRFVVHTGKVDVIVTGTQFNVVSRDNKTNVYLKEGSVTLRDEAGNELKMKPGDYVEIDHSKMLMKPVCDKNVLAWQEKKMIFDSASLYDVAARLKEVYGVNVIVDSTLKGKIISGILPNDDLDVILKALEISEDFKIARNQNTITISH
ncbi:FecR family protein [Chitinophagaceae bacterium LWZ2-11]